MNDWWIFKGTRKPHDFIEQKLPDPPKWRRYRSDSKDQDHKQGNEERGATYLSSNTERDLVNAALYLRRPLLVTGGPGTGKTSLAYAVAYELNLGPVLVWPINTRSTFKEGLYSYDAIARLQEITIKKESRSTSEQQDTLIGAQKEAREIGRFLRLGPLGTALCTSRPKRPRVLLIDEIDKSDIDLPNDLLHIFEEGEFEIPELARLPEQEDCPAKVRPWDEGPEVEIERGRVHCEEFPFVVMTSNAERDFPPPFLRRCLCLKIDDPSAEKLAEIIEQHLKLESAEQPGYLVNDFLARKKDLATDQLLNAIFLTMNGVDLSKREELRQILLKSLSSP